MTRWLWVTAAVLAACGGPQRIPDAANDAAVAEAAPVEDSSTETDSAPDVAPVSDASSDGADAVADSSGADACVGTFVVYTDGDGDGFGAGGPLEVRCGDPVSPRASFRNGDCNDMDPRIFPGAAEHCDGVDSNCDGESTDRTAAPLEPPMSPRDDAHINCATVGQSLGVWNLATWGYYPRCAYRGLESFPPFRNVGMLVCQACRSQNGGECACWTDPANGGGMSIPCPYDG